MGNLRLKRLASVGLVVLGLIVLISFQNCGFSGFVTNVQESSLDSGRLSTPDGSTTDITTAPVGKLVHFDIPAQLVSLKISVIDQSQNQILGYSALLNKLVAFNPDGKSYQEVAIPESQLKKVIKVTPFQKYSSMGAGRYLYSNPGFVVAYEDLQKVVRYGIMQTKDRSWARLDFPLDCEPLVRSMPSADYRFAYCTNSKTKSFHYQKIDSNGKPSGSVIQASELFDISNSVSLGDDIWVNSGWTKKLVLSTGAVSSLPDTFTTKPMPSYYFSVYRPEKNTVIYASYEQNGLRERNLSTGAEAYLLDSQYQYQINVLNENTFIIRDQATNGRYIISGTAATAVAPLSASILGYAMSSTQVAFFTPDPSSTSLRVDVKLYDLKTLAAASLCTASMPSSSDFFGEAVGYINYFPYFNSSIGSDPNSYGMGISFVMDRSCTDLYLATVSSTRGENPKVSRALYKYGVRSILTKTLFTNMIDPDGMGYFGNFIGIDNGTLYFMLAQGTNVYAANNPGSLDSMLYGSIYTQYSVDSEVSNWNYSIFRVQDRSGVRKYIMPLQDSGVLSFSLPKVKSTPPSQFLTNGGENYILLTRESDSDTASADAYSIQFYNAKNEMMKKEKFFVSPKDSTVSNLTGWDRSNTQNPYIAFRMYGSLNNKEKSVYVVANLQNQTVSLIDPPADIQLGWDTYVYPEIDSIVSVRAACSITRNQCVSNPFGVATTSSDSAYGGKLINGYYYFQMYINSKSSFKRYSYNGNLSFTERSELAEYSGQISQDGKWMASVDYTTRKVSLYNLNTGAKQELSITLDSVWFVKNGLMGYLQDSDQTYSSWFIDLNTLKSEKLTELSGNKTAYIYMYSANPSSVVNNLTSDTVVLSDQNSVVFFNLSTKKIIKKISIMSANIVWESADQIILGQTSAASYYTTDFKYKLTTVDMKTFTEKEIDISAYETFICQSIASQQTYCIGKRGGSHSLMKYSASKQGFDNVAELTADFNFGGVLFLNKNLSVFTFSTVNYIEKYIMVGRASASAIGNGWEAYLYKQ